jgi:hypothetical protein
MKTRKMFNEVAAALMLLAIVVAAGAAGAEEINFNNVPLDDAIASLARLTGRNFILDPKLSASFDAEGKVSQRPTVTLHLENTTAGQALGQILKNHGLILIEDPVTTVARITFTNEPVMKTTDANFLAGDTNPPVPMLVFQDVPLCVALDEIARSGKIKVVIDSKLSDSYHTADGKFIIPPSVSVRWKNLTARQALLALCLNYDLAIIKDERTGVWSIETRK